MTPEHRAVLVQDIAGDLERIRRRFLRPQDVRLTVIVRTPWLEDGGVLVSDDDYSRAAAEMSRLCEQRAEHEKGGAA